MIGPCEWVNNFPQINSGAAALRTESLAKMDESTPVREMLGCKIISDSSQPWHPQYRAVRALVQSRVRSAGDKLSSRGVQVAGTLRCGVTALILEPLAGRPRHRPAAKQVKVQMVDRLTGVCSAVDHHSVTGIKSQGAR